MKAQIIEQTWDVINAGYSRELSNLKTVFLGWSGNKKIKLIIEEKGSMSDFMTQNITGDIEIDISITTKHTHKL